MWDASAFLSAYLEAHNEGVRSGDFTGLVGLLAEDASMIFEGFPISIGPYEGREAIAGAFAEHPPDDVLILDDLSSYCDEVTARYSWGVSPGLQEGSIRLVSRDGWICRIHISRG